MNDELVDQAVEACGGKAKLAALVGASVQTVWNWRQRGVPVERCALLEQVSGLRVRRWDLRPNDWHRIWPELIGTEGAPAVRTDQPHAEAA